METECHTRTGEGYRNQETRYLILTKVGGILGPVIPFPQGET